MRSPAVKLIPAIITVSLSVSALLSQATETTTLISLTASAENQQTPKTTNKIDPLPRDLEIQLALSALPPHLRDKRYMF
jgi:predicted protein tyrosine phosphatase